MTEDQIKELVESIVSIDRTLSKKKFQQQVELAVVKFQTSGTSGTSNESVPVKTGNNPSWRGSVHSSIGPNAKRQPGQKEKEKSFYIRSAGDSARADK